MEVRVQQASVEQIEQGGLILPFFDQECSPDSFPYPELVERRGDALLESLEQIDFEGKPDQCLVLCPWGDNKVPVALVGLGTPEELDPTTLAEAHARGVRGLERAGVRQVSVPVRKTGDLPEAIWARSVVEGIHLAQYRFDEMKSSAPKRKEFERLDLLVESLSPELESAVQAGSSRSRWICFARDLGNLPANRGTPREMASRAQDALSEHPVEIRTTEGLEALSKFPMPALCAVSKGSVEPPVLLEIEYNAASRGKVPTIALVGKGVTFDAGGISIKGSNKMELMKLDMCGAAAVVGAMGILAESQPDLHVIGICPFCENLPSGSAYKPSDVVDTHAGLTVEIINTDGEGRLILADAISYASTFEPETIIDVATLTGASMVALGHRYIAMIGTDVEAMSALDRSGRRTGDRVWQLPIDRHFKKQMKGTTADLQNAGGRFGGACLAAAFLSSFAGDCPWVHLDIAPTAWVEKPGPCSPKGATGSAVRLLAEFIENWIGRNQGDAA